MKPAPDSHGGRGRVVYYYLELPQPRSQGLSSFRPLEQEEERPWERGWNSHFLEHFCWTCLREIAESIVVCYEDLGSVSSKNSEQIDHTHYPDLE